MNLIVFTGNTTIQSHLVGAQLSLKHLRLIREAGSQGIVLLKDENNILVLQVKNLERIAVFGSTEHCLGHGGGLASVNAHHRNLPSKALEAIFDAEIEMIYAGGVHLTRTLPVLSNNTIDVEGKPSLTTSKYSPSNSNEILMVNTLESCQPVSSDEGDNSKVTIGGDYTPVESGSHYPKLSPSGMLRFASTAREP